MRALGKAAAAGKSTGRPVRVGQPGLETESGDGDGDVEETVSASGRVGKSKGQTVGRLHFVP